MVAAKARKERAAQVIPANASEKELALHFNRRVQGDVEVIRSVCRKSGHLQGVCQKALKDATTSILKVVEEIGNRTATEELVKMQTAYNKMEEINKKQAGEL